MTKRCRKADKKLSRHIRKYFRYHVWFAEYQNQFYDFHCLLEQNEVCHFRCATFCVLIYWARIFDLVPAAARESNSTSNAIVVELDENHQHVVSLYFKSYGLQNKHSNKPYQLLEDGMKSFTETLSFKPF